MHIGTLRTRIIQHPSMPEGGFFDWEVTVDDAAFKHSADKRGFTMMLISFHLSEQVKNTTVPVQLWTFEPTEEVARAFGLPELLDFSAGAPL